MESSVLYSITDSFDLEQIPTVWKNIDFNTFSTGKKLYPYQQLIVLSGYPEVFLDNPHVDRAFAFGQIKYLY